jgi:hypothetical protein
VLVCKRALYPNSGECPPPYNWHHSGFHLSLFFKMVPHILLYTTSILTTALATETVPAVLFGPDAPVPRSPSNTSAFRNATSTMKAAIESAISTGTTIYSDIDSNTTSFSLDIFSVHEEETLFSYHYNAPGLSNATEGVKTVDSNTIYRLGSVSKLLTVYTFLSTVGDMTFNEPITKYMPELAAYSKNHHDSDDWLDVTDWHSVTIGAIASELGAISRERGRDALQDGLIQSLLPSYLFPPLPPIPSNLSTANCPNPLYVPCTRATFLESIEREHPAFAPFYGPSDSNIAFALLAFALENMTNKTFPTLMASNLLSPLHLNSTYYTSPPANASAINPFNDRTANYSADILFEDPAGSYYSSINDMRTLGKSILNSTVLSEAQTRR